MRIYENKYHFHAERGEREYSGEADFGVWRVDDVGIEGWGLTPVEPVDTNIGGLDYLFDEGLNFRGGSGRVQLGG